MTRRGHQVDSGTLYWPTTHQLVEWLHIAGRSDLVGDLVFAVSAAEYDTHLRSITWQHPKMPLDAKCDRAVFRCLTGPNAPQRKDQPSRAPEPEPVTSTPEISPIRFDTLVYIVAGSAILHLVAEVVDAIW